MQATEEEIILAIANELFHRVDRLAHPPVRCILARLNAVSRKKYTADLIAQVLRSWRLKHPPRVDFQGYLPLEVIPDEVRALIRKEAELFYVKHGGRRLPHANRIGQDLGMAVRVVAPVLDAWFGQLFRTQDAK